MYDRVGYKIYMECSLGKHKADCKLSRRMKVFQTCYNEKEQTIRYE